MIPVLGRAEPLGLLGDLDCDVWRVGSAAEVPTGLPVAALTDPDGPVLSGHRLYLTRDGAAALPGPALVLPRTLSHLEPGDVVGLSGDGRRVTVLYKRSARHNSLLLTEQCDNYCIMCSQPPKDRDDRWLYQRARRIVALLPPEVPALGLTGGEPALFPDELIALLGSCAEHIPSTAIHLLSNGRRFSDPAFTARYAGVGVPDLMVGIPLYGAEPGLHNFVVQAEDAFEETVRGILALGAHGMRVEVRVVLQQWTAPALPAIAEYIARNLPFVAQVALMGLEMTGLARPNAASVWIDPVDYQADLLWAVRALAAAHVRPLIYNHQLCVLDERLWPYAVPSISEWKNDYLPVCQDCAVRDACGGVFTTSNRYSAHLAPLSARVAG